MSYGFKSSGRGRTKRRLNLNHLLILAPFLKRGTATAPSSLLPFERMVPILVAEPFTEPTFELFHLLD